MTLSKIKPSYAPKSKGEITTGFSIGEKYDIGKNIASQVAIKNYEKSKEALEDKWGEGSWLSNIQSIWGVGDIAAGVGEKLGFFW